MASDKMKRKLTTIFCADVQSYTRLMAGDEAETLARLRRYRAIMNELFERHEGRQVNTWGDAVIAEFASVVEAVRSAVEIQEAIGDENRELPAGQQMRFRIGINLGDVMQDGGDLYGDGVNVAARLQALADPGGIMVSETVFNLTSRHLSVSYDFAGEQRVKDEDEPIVGYRVRMPGQKVVSAPPSAAGNEAIAEKVTAVSGRRPLRKSLSRLLTPFAWMGNQRKAVRASFFMIAMFAMINLLSNGFSQIWFVYPSIPFAFFIVVQGLGRRG
jgi:adenylate cyclase